METIVGSLVFLYLIMWFLGYYLDVVFRRRLKNFYPDLGANLKPGILQKSMDTDVQTTRFILGREYSTLDNPDFVKFCVRYRIFMMASFIVFGVTAVALVIYFIVD
jgi:hypothetical protein